jgi:hypothetical protein
MSSNDVFVGQVSSRFNQRKLSKLQLVVIALLFAAVMTYLVIRVFAASGVATLYTSPGGTQSVTTGQTFTVNVRLSSGASVPVTGAAVYLSYPTSLLQVVGQSYSGSPYNTQLVATNSGGILRMDRAAFPAVSGGDQLFAQITFKALTTGSATISFTNSSIVTSGEDDSNILTAKNGATYNISAPAKLPTSGGGGGSSGSTSSAGGSSGGSAPKSGSGSTAPSSGGSNSPASGSSGSTSPGGSASQQAESDNNSSGASAASSATSSLLITIFDTQNKPIAGAEVAIVGQTVKTDKNGVARFSDVPVGDQAITVKYNGKKTSKTLNVKNVSMQSPEPYKIAIARDKFNPIVLIIPILILLTVGLNIRRPWQRLAFAGNNADNPETAAVVVSSNHADAMPTPQPLNRHLEAPGTVVSPTASGTSSTSSQDDPTKE